MRSTNAQFASTKMPLDSELSPFEVLDSALGEAPPRYRPKAYPPQEETLSSNVGMYRSRKKAGLIEVRTTAEVQNVLSSLSRVPNVPPLQALITGHNWGLGSAAPTKDGAAILDLSAMKTIRAIDLEAGWAVVEPGC